MRNRNPRRIVVAALVIALVNLMFAFRSPDFENLRTVTFLHLVAGGFLLGIACGILLAGRRQEATS